MKICKLLISVIVMLTMTMSMAARADNISHEQEIELAKAGDIMAMNHLAVVAVKHHHYGQAYYWLKQALPYGSTATYSSLGYLYLYGYGHSSANYKLGYKYAKLAANSGVAASQNDLCNVYLFGLGKQKSRTLAEPYCIKAANAHVNPKFATNAGFALLYSNPNEAYKWFKLGAQGGDPRGMAGEGALLSAGTNKIKADPILGYGLLMRALKHHAYYSVSSLFKIYNRVIPANIRQEAMKKYGQPNAEEKLKMIDASKNHKPGQI